MRTVKEYTRYLDQNKIVLPPPLDSEKRREEPGGIDHDITMVAIVNRPHTNVRGQRSPAEHSRGIFSASGQTRTSAKFVEFKVSLLSSSYLPCHVVLVMMSVHGLLSRVQPVISDTDIPLSPAWPNG